MNRQLQQAKYIFADWTASIISWTLFFMYRKYYISLEPFSWAEVFGDVNFYYGILVVPFFWLILYVIAGYYRKVFRKSRIRELSQIFSTTFIGVTIIFFTLILDDMVVSYRSYLQSFLMLFSLQFVITSIFHLTITTRTVKKIHRKKIGFNTIVVGSRDNAVKIFLDLDKEFPSAGNKFVGFVNAKLYDKYKLADYLPHLGNYKDLPRLIRELKVEEVIIAVERQEQKLVENIIADYTTLIG